MIEEIGVILKGLNLPDSLESKQYMLVNQKIHGAIRAIEDFTAGQSQ